MAAFYLKGTFMQSTNKSIQLLTLGNTIMDLEFHIEDSKLLELGIEKQSMILIDKSRKDELLSKFGKEDNLCCGGSIANSLYIATKLGCKGHHIGVIGTDLIGEKTIQDYSNNNIGQSFNESKVNGDSGCCIVLITPDGERTMLTYLGVSSSFNSIDFIYPLIDQSERFFIEGYLLSDDSSYELILNNLIPYAKKMNIPILFSLSNAGLVGFFKSRFLAVLEKNIDIIFCNKSEAEAISDKNTPEEFQSFFNQYTKEVIITDGNNGAFAIEKEKITYFPTEPIIPIDSTGAGDAFAGAYISGMINDQSKETIGLLANKTAKIVVSQMGARPESLEII